MRKLPAWFLNESIEIIQPDIQNNVSSECYSGFKSLDLGKNDILTAPELPVGFTFYLPHDYEPHGY